MPKLATQVHPNSSRFCLEPSPWRLLLLKAGPCTWSPRPPHLLEHERTGNVLAADQNGVKCRCQWLLQFQFQFPFRGQRCKWKKMSKRSSSLGGCGDGNVQTKLHQPCQVLLQCALQLLQASIFHIWLNLFIAEKPGSEQSLVPSTC